MENHRKTAQACILVLSLVVTAASGAVNADGWPESGPAMLLDEPLPDLSTQLKLMSGIGDSDVTVSAIVRNSGGVSNATLIELRVDQRILEPIRLSSPVPRLHHNATFVHNFSFASDVRPITLVLKVDEDGTVAEADEENNLASLVVDDGVYEPIPRLSMAGGRASATVPETAIMERRPGAVRIRPAGIAFLEDVTVDRSLLLETLAAPALLDGEFEWVAEGEHVVARVRVESLENKGRVLWTEFDPELGIPQYTQGSGDSIWLTDRPMRLDIAYPEIPAGANSTVAPLSHGPAMFIDAEDGNSSGQLISINRNWFRSLAPGTPYASFPDGSSIGVSKEATAWILDVPHFSPFVVGFSPPNFDLLNDQPLSALELDSEGFLSIQSNSRSQVDESRVTPFNIGGTTVLQAHVYRTSGLVAAPIYPLAVGNRQERSFPDPADSDGIRKAMGFLVRSNNAGELFVTAFSWRGGEPAPTYHFSTVLGAARKLELRITSVATTFAVTFPHDDVPIEQAIVPSHLLPYADIDVVVASVEGAGASCPNGGQSCTGKVLARNYRLAFEEGNMANEDFLSSLDWVLDHDASCCPGNALSLNLDTSNSVGRASYESPMNAVRFSASFQFTVPDWAPTQNTPGGAGFAFLFYKDMGYLPAPESLGIADRDFEEYSPGGHEGYAIAFRPYDTWWDGRWHGSIDLVVDDINNMNPGASGTPFGGGILTGSHAVNIIAQANRIQVYVDQVLVINAVLQFDRTYDALGFSASTSFLGRSLHLIEAFKISTAADVPAAPQLPPFKPRAGQPDTPGVNPGTVNLTWAGGDPNGDLVAYDVGFGLKDQARTSVCPALATAAMRPVCSVSGIVQGEEYCVDVATAFDEQETHWCFRANRAPNATVLPTPSHGAAAQPFTLDISWASGGDADHQPLAFAVLFGTSNPPITPLCTVTEISGAPLRCRVGELSPSTSYFWRVVTTDGVLSTLGPVWAFTTGQNLAPLDPSSPEPAHGGRTGVSVVLRWQGGDANVQNPTYTVKFGTTTPPSTTLCTARNALPDLDAADSGSCAAPSLQQSIRYYWQVEAWDGVATTAGPVWDFMIGRPPDPASDPIPADKAVDVWPSLELGWKGSDPDGDRLAYVAHMLYTYTECTELDEETQECERWEDFSYWGVACATDGTQTCTQYLEMDTEYQWYVDSNDGWATTRSPAWSFGTCRQPDADLDGPDFGPTTQSWPAAATRWASSYPAQAVNEAQPGTCTIEKPLYTPAGPRPRHEATNVDPWMTNLTWTPRFGETFYRVYLDLVDPPRRVVCETYDAWCVPSDMLLLFETTYRWRVEATYGVTVVQGSVWTFATGSCSGDWCPSMEEKTQIAYGNARQGMAEPNDPSPRLNSGDQAMTESAGSIASNAAPKPTNENCPTLRPGTSSRACVVLLIHGIAGYFEDGGKEARIDGWVALERDLLRDQGFVVESLTFYGGECRHSDQNVWDISTHGSHHDVFANHHEDGDEMGCSGQQPFVHSLSTDIRHLSHHLAWYIYDTRTKIGDPVDIVTHSMGGLISRYAIQMVQNGVEGFPPRLDIEDIVTYSTPHNGGQFFDVSPSEGACQNSPAVRAAMYYQQTQMCPGSSFIKWLGDHASNPQTFRGTDWTLIGSFEDDFVNEDSAVAMKTGMAILYHDPDYQHSSFYGDIGPDPNAHVEWAEYTDSSAASRNVAGTTGGTGRASSASRVWSNDYSQFRAGWAAFESLLEDWR